VDLLVRVVELGLLSVHIAGYTAEGMWNLIWCTVLKIIDLMDLCSLYYNKCSVGMQIVGK
jgi:hypothetical protein